MFTDELHRRGFVDVARCKLEAQQLDRFLYVSVHGRFSCQAVAAQNLFLVKLSPD